MLEACKNFVYSIIRRSALNHWGRVTHVCISKLTIIGSDNGLSLGRCQAIIWTSAGILLIGPLGTNLGEILIRIYTFSCKKMQLKMSSGKWQPSCVSLNVLINLWKVWKPKPWKFSWSVYREPYRHYSGHGLSQWEKSLHSNISSHWLSPIPRMIPAQRTVHLACRWPFLDLRNQVIGVQVIWIMIIDFLYQPIEAEWRIYASIK